MTLESISSEGLLYNFPVRVQTAELLHSQSEATLRELPLSQNLGILQPGLLEVITFNIVNLTCGLQKDISQSECSRYLPQ